MLIARIKRLINIKYVNKLINELKITALFKIQLN